jgi:hypothetical protein
MDNVTNAHAHHCIIGQAILDAKQAHSLNSLFPHYLHLANALPTRGLPGGWGPLVDQKSPRVAYF